MLPDGDEPLFIALPGAAHSDHIPDERAGPDAVCRMAPRKRTDERHSEGVPSSHSTLPDRSWPRRPEDWGDAPVGVCVAGDEANGAETDENAAHRYHGDTQGIETGVATAP